MSHLRAKKVGGPEEGSQKRGSLTKASGDCNLPSQPGPLKQQSHASKGKLPKSLRYDLENALVGLCDAWFEEIKPYLVRNNIKVHVNNSAGSGDDHQRLPPGAPGCSHLDPGAAPDRYRRRSANYANCCSTQPTASKAQCHRPPLQRPQHSPIPVLHPEKLRSDLLKPRQTYDTKQPRHPRPRRSPRTQRKEPQVDWRSPQTCQTYSVLMPNACTKHPTRKTRKANPPSQISERKPKTENKSTQTPPMHQSGKNTSNRPSSRSPVNRSSRPEQEHFNLSRSPTTTTLCSQHRTDPAAPLFQEDLLDVIAEKYDKKIKVLFTSPRREYSNPSMMNLVPISPLRLHAPVRKKHPWK